MHGSFLELMEKPDVEHISGLSPAISIEQRNPSKNPRSTVATVTEIYDYLRLLFARVGKRHCPQCGRPVESWSVQGITADILKKFADKNVYIFSPLVRGRAGTYEELFTRLKKEGYVKARVDGTLCTLDTPPTLERYKKHTIELLADEIYVDEFERERIVESLELAFKIFQRAGDRTGNGRQKSRRIYLQRKQRLRTLRYRVLGAGTEAVFV